MQILVAALCRGGDNEFQTQQLWFLSSKAKDFFFKAAEAVQAVKPPGLKVSRQCLWSDKDLCSTSKAVTPCPLSHIAASFFLFFFRPGVSRRCIFVSVSDQVSHITASLFLLHTRCLYFCFTPGVFVFVSHQVSLFLFHIAASFFSVSDQVSRILSCASDQVTHVASSLFLFQTRFLSLLCPSVSDQVSHVTESLFLFQTRCRMWWHLSVSDQCLMSLCPCFCFRPGVSHHYICVSVSDQARPDQVSLFLTESLVLKGMAHPNIYPLLGACSDEEGPPMVMYPYTHEGNMKKFLQKCRMSECGSRYVSFSLMGWGEGSGRGQGYASKSNVGFYSVHLGFTGKKEKLWMTAGEK